MVKQIFVNLPIKDLKNTTEFFTKLGFTFNPKFTDENGTCMIIGENIFAMLLVEKFYQTFTKKQIADAFKTNEVLLAIQFESRAQVDEVMEKGIAAGGKESGDMQDHGWMYSRSLEDLDGHVWEIFFMDESQAPQQAQQ